MIEIYDKKYGIKKSIIYFADKPMFSFNPFLKYYQCKGNNQYWWLIRKPFFTKVISLIKSPEEILLGFDKNTRYEILRSEKEKIIEILPEGSLSHFSQIQNEINKLKQNNTKINLSAYRDNICFTTCLFNGNPIIVHSYLMDKNLKRTRLLHSLSLSESIADKSVRAMYGRANRQLHYMDIVYYKEKGYLVYDLGGYAYNSLDNKLQGINKFKDGFGGELIEESNYESLLIFSIKKIIRSIKSAFK
jgi:lipid II:glycine glycyltransferase (peptidoglycan interpeptide bridge formation enzyme)